MDPPTEEELKAQEAAKAQTAEPVLEPEPTEPDADADASPPDETTMPSAAPPPPPPAAEDAPAPAPAPAIPSSPSADIQIPAAQDFGERSKQFLELRSYEAKRRSIYTHKQKSTALYWKAFRSLLSKSYQETDRAENLIRGVHLANEAYARVLAAAADDRLDYNGKPVDERRGKRLQEDRRKKYSHLGGGSLLMGMSMEIDRKQQEKEREKIKKKADYAAINSDLSQPGLTSAAVATAATLDASEQGSGEEAGIEPAISFEGLPEDSLIKSLVECQFEMAEAFNENVKFVGDVVCVKLVELKKELEAECSVMSALGDATIFELDRAEEDVQKAWSAYFSIASLIDKDKEAARAEKANNAGVDPNAIVDVWLLEMHYRMAVAYLTTVWEKSSKELTDLFAGVKELETNRRHRLKEILILYAKRADTLWNAMPTANHAVLESLENADTTPSVVEKDVTDTVREKAKKYKEREERESAPIINTGPGLMGVPEPDPNFELQSPLVSDLLTKVEVIWRKSDKLMSVWKPCIAITTSDCYLHLFEIPAHENVPVGTKPELAFQTLVPAVTVPTEDAIVQGILPNSATWYENLIPGASLDLKNSNISFNQKKGNSTFEITETMAASGFKISKNPKKRRFSLRLNSSQDMVEWLLALRALGAD